MIAALLRLRVPLPCPLNGLYRAVVLPGQRWPRQILSQRARQRRDLVVRALLEQTAGRVRPVFAGPVSIADMTIVPPDRRPRDLDAFDKQLFDCLTKAGILLDDKQIKHYGGREMLAPERPGWIDLTIVELPA